MDAVYSIVPGALFFVEGTGQYAPGYDGLAFNYGKLVSSANSMVRVLVCSVTKLTLLFFAGDGLASSSAAFDEYRGISDAGLFFEQVLSKPYLSQVCHLPPDRRCCYT